MVSALMQPEFNAPVVRWADGCPSLSLWTTSASVFEIRFGLALLDEGRRRSTLAARLERLLDDALEGRVLAVGVAVAEQAAEAAAFCQKRGRRGETCDLLIAGSALHHRATLATRNTKHFEGLAIPLVDPWSA